MPAGKSIAWALGVILGLLIPHSSHSDEADEIDATIASCGAPLPSEAADAQRKQKLLACLKAKADSGHLEPDDLILTLAKLLEEAGRNQDALEYLAYWYAVEPTERAACSHGSGSARLGDGDVILGFGAAERDPAVTADMRREAVRRALALEAATATTRQHHPTYCLDAAGRKPIPGSIDEIYVSEPVWRQRRSEILRNSESFLLVVVGVRPASQKP